MNERTVIKLKKRNESYIEVIAHEMIIKELGRFFSAKAPNFRFHPLYKQGIWDGILRFLDRNSNTISHGLHHEIDVFAKKGGYSVERDFNDKSDLSVKDFLEFVESLNLPFKARDYQLAAAYESIKNHKLCVKSVTSSGKSLIIYIIIRFMESLGKKTILIVPNVSLVEQMMSDFDDYGWEHVGDKCHMIYGGQKKVFDCPVIISTWQSLFRNTELFKVFDCLIVDEAHLAKGSSLTTIGKSCTRAHHKIGFSGTFPEYGTAEWFTITGNLGRIKEFSSYKLLQDQGHIAQLKIFSVFLDYPESFKREVMKKTMKDYAAETDYVNGNPKRHEFLARMIQKMEGNTLVLFTKKEKHGYPLKLELEKRLVGKKLYYIDGDVDPKERERIRHLMETRDDIVLLATYGTLSTGVNIKNIKHLVFASSYKSMVKVLQSIGRILRNHPDKKFATLYDVIDYLVLNVDGKIWENYSVKHYKERNKIYKNEGFDVKKVRIEII